MRGALIILEGLDRSGKTTQCEKLVEELKGRGYQVEGKKFPDRSTDIGKVINGYLQKRIELDNHAVRLLFSANQWEHSSNILDNLEKRTTLIVDRYSYSGAAYGGATEGISMDWCKQLDVGLPEPDLVLFLDLPPQKVKDRKDFGEERYEQKEVQEKVYTNFMVLKSDKWKVVDASQSINDVHKEILTAALEVIDKVGKTPVGKLWIE